MNTFKVKLYDERIDNYSNSFVEENDEQQRPTELIFDLRNQEEHDSFIEILQLRKAITISLKKAEDEGSVKYFLQEDLKSKTNIITALSDGRKSLKEEDQLRSLKKLFIHLQK